MNISAQGTMDVYDTLAVVFDEPVPELNKDFFRLDQKVDTTWMPAEFELIADTANSLGIFLHRKWKYEETFRLEVDSATIYSIYGKWNKPVSLTFTIKNEDQYGHLYFNLQGLDTLSAFVELLNSSDTPIRKAKVKDGGALFMDIPPGKYYARIVVDENNNFVWDPGNYAEKRQPEHVFYYPKEVEIMKNWEIEETWDIQATPLNRQKPLEVTKNKPKEVTKTRKDYKNEGRNQSSGNSNQMGRSIPF
jgi:hypothetical protein